jgi:hypothetical protein
MDWRRPVFLPLTCLSRTLDKKDQPAFEGGVWRPSNPTGEAGFRVRAENGNSTDRT